MPHLSELLPSTLQTVAELAAKPNTPQPGSMVVAGNPTTQLEKSRINGQMDTAKAHEIASRLRMNSLWRIERTEEERALLKALLKESLTPTSHKDAIYWLTRFTKHFPSKDIERDAIIIGDLASEFEAKKYPIGAVINALHEMMLEGTIENPWMPPSGAIVTRVRNKANSYASIYNRELKQ